MNIWVELDPVGVKVSHSGRSGDKVYEKPETAVEQGASTGIVIRRTGSEYENDLLGKDTNVFGFDTNTSERLLTVWIFVENRYVDVFKLRLDPTLSEAKFSLFVCV